MKRINKEKISAIIMYSLPIAFFAISYFLITTSGEDIHQGTHADPNPFKAAIDHFFINARVSDMVAWGVTKFLDYQFSYGVDTIIRIVDLFLMCGIIYGLTYIALQRRPQLRISDAAIFNFISIAILITPFGRVFYTGFSLIHNYIIIVGAPVMAAILLINNSLKKSTTNKWLSLLGMVIFGFIFGVSSNLVPLAAVLTLIIYLIYKKMNKKHLEITNLRKKIAMLIGVLIGIYASFFIGPGVSDYASGGYAISYDYVSFGQIINNPSIAIPKIIRHEIYNYGRVLAPLIGILFGILIIQYVFNRLKIIKKLTFSNRAKDIILISFIFLIIYTLTMSQINFPYRLAAPAYIAGVIILAILIDEVLNNIIKVEGKNILILLIVAASIAITITHGVFMINYHQQSKKVLLEIEQNHTQEMCVNKEDIQTISSPNGFMVQEDMLAEWAMPEVVYGKTVTFCQPGG